MNSLMVIAPYKFEGFWVFDDEDAGLVKEPFVSGADEIIDKALEVKGIEGNDGFRLLFGAEDFPGADYEFSWVREDKGGNWYHCKALGMEGWLCPALFKYFENAPNFLYAQFKSK